MLLNIKELRIHSSNTYKLLIYHLYTNNSYTTHRYGPSTKSVVLSDYSMYKALAGIENTVNTFNIHRP